MRALAGVPVGEGFAARLAERKGLTPAQIRTAVKFAKLAGDGTGLEALIERQLVNADKALGNTSAERGARHVVTQYDLGLVNTESRFEVPKIVEALRRKSYGTLCFYGPPGTGKTALAEHIAAGRPLLVKQASDLMSKMSARPSRTWRPCSGGRGEESRAAADEADLPADRRGAQRTYEVTEVNEMLQGMERFDGIFVCTTNLLDRLDQAALRRFTFKIKFMPLTGDQRERMFVTEALEGDAMRLTSEIKFRLAKLPQLAQAISQPERQTDVRGFVLGWRVPRSAGRRRRIKPSARIARHQLVQ